uniref:Uncharacterized protein n=1 Tax=Cannabis sativa TaxID=3483 RepID=A0A803QHE3_CANSA
MEKLGAREVLPFVDSDLRRIAVLVVEKAKEVCVSKSHPPPPYHYPYMYGPQPQQPQSQQPMPPYVYPEHKDMPGSSSFPQQMPPYSWPMPPMSSMPQ